MRGLIAAALRLRVAVAALAIVAMVVGIQVAATAPLDVFPEFAPPLVEIQTEAPGLSTEEVEALVTAPIEQALNGTPYLATLRSKSVLGLSSVVLLFDRGTDLLEARQFVSERMATLTAQLPSVAHRPVLLSPLSSTSRVLKVGLVVENAHPDRTHHAGAVDDPAAPDRRARRRECRDLGSARS